MPLRYDTIIYKICTCQKHNRIETRVFVSKGAKCVEPRTGNSEAHNNFCQKQNFFGSSCASCILKL